MADHAVARAVVLATLTLTLGASSCADEFLVPAPPIVPDTLPPPVIDDVDASLACAPLDDAEAIDAWGAPSSTTTNRSRARGPARNSRSWSVLPENADDLLAYDAVLARGDRLIAAVDESPDFWANGVATCTRYVEARSVCDGELLWRTDVAPLAECFVSSTSAVGLLDGIAYVSVRDRVDDVTAQLHAYDVASGALLWAAPATLPVSKLAGSDGGNPVFVLGFVPTKLDRDSGAVLWDARGALRAPSPDESTGPAFSAVLDFVAQAGVGFGRVVEQSLEQGSFQCSVMALDLASGAKLGESAVVPCEVAGSLVVGNAGRVYAFDFDGESAGTLTAWDFAGDTFARAWSTSVVGFATPAASPTGDVFLLTAAGELFVLDDVTGALRARRAIEGGDPDSSFALVLDGAGKAFVASNVDDDARIEAFDATLSPSWSTIRQDGAFTFVWPSELGIAQGGALVQAGQGLVVYLE